MVTDLGCSAAEVVPDIGGIASGWIDEGHMTMLLALDAVPSIEGFFEIVGR